MSNDNSKPNERPDPPFALAHGSAAEPRRPSLEQLEKMLASGELLDIQINPDGSISAVPKGTAVNSEVVPLTLKQVAAQYY